MNAASNWDGKTKGSLWGYRFFVGCIRFLGVYVSYFFCIWVSLYYVLIVRKQRNALIRFYRLGLGYGRLRAFFTAVRAFYVFGQVLIDRVAFKTSRKKIYSHSFANEKALHDLIDMGQGGFLCSGHVGNWETAGNLIGERITSKIHVFMLDAEVERIKHLLEHSTEQSKYNLIPLRDDMSHLISIHQALKRKELIAMHADRKVPGQKNFQLPFLGGVASFPAGPFVMAHKFNVPITFVFAVKTKTTHYALSATEPLMHASSPEAIAQKYVERLEEIVRAYPAQWFNFYDFYAD